MPKSKGKNRIKNPATTALHGAHMDGKHHVVGIGNLRVIIVPDGDLLFAQGLEIDYAAQGGSVDDARAQFEDGLCATVHEHLRVYGDIQRLLQPAPPEVWKELLLSAPAVRDRYSQLSVHCLEKLQQVLPFQGIDYLQLERVT